MGSTSDYKIVLKNVTKDEVCKQLSKELDLTNEDAELFASFLTESAFCYDGRTGSNTSSTYDENPVCQDHPTYAEPPSASPIDGVNRKSGCLLSSIIGLVIVIVAVAIVADLVSTLTGIGIIIAALILNLIIAKLGNIDEVTVGNRSICISKTTLALLSCLLGFTPLGNISQIGELLKDLGDSIKQLSDEEKILLAYLKSAHKDIHRDLLTKELKDTINSKSNKGLLIKTEEELNNLLDSLAEKNLIKIRMTTIIIL